LLPAPAAAALDATDSPPLFLTFYHALFFCLVSLVTLWCHVVLNAQPTAAFYLLFFLLCSLPFLCIRCFSMSSHDRPVHDVLGRMSDDDEGDDVSDDLDLTFVPKSERVKRLQQSRQTTSSLQDPQSPNNGLSSLHTAARTETVYEQERNAKVRALLAEQQCSNQRRGIFTVDLFDSPLDTDPRSTAMTMATTGTATSLSSSSALSFTSGDVAAQRGWRRPYDAAPTNRGGRGGASRDASHAAFSGDRQRRFRMPHPNITDEERARFIRSRRNMAVVRNALREVDPETLEYTQIIQAPDQVPAFGRGGGGAGSTMGNPANHSYGSRGASGGMGGRGMGYRGRGGDGRGGGGGGGRGYGYGNSAGAQRGGGASFRPYQ
jgi:hypothetical protein